MSSKKSGVSGRTGMSESSQAALRPQPRQMTTEQAQQMARMGHEVKKKKKAEKKFCAEVARQILDAKCKVNDRDVELLEYMGLETEDVTNRTMMMASLHRKARTGSVYATQYFLQIAGEDPEHNLRRELAQKASLMGIIEDLRAIDEQIDSGDND